MGHGGLQSLRDYREALSAPQGTPDDDPRQTRVALLPRAFAEPLRRDDVATLAALQAKAMSHPRTRGEATTWALARGQAIQVQPADDVLNQSDSLQGASLSFAPIARKSMRTKCTDWRRSV